MNCFYSKLATATAVALTLAACSHTPTETDSAGTQPPVAGSQVVLAYQMGRQGMIDPCGCTVSPNGGLDREYNALTKLRGDASVLFVDGGDMYAPVKHLKGMNAKLYRERAVAMTEILNDLALDVFAPGPGDMLLGKSFLLEQQKQAKFAFLSTNLMDSNGKPLFAQSQVIERGGLKFGLLAISPAAHKLPEGMKLVDPKKALKEWVPKVASQSDYVVVLSQLGNIKMDEAWAKEFPQVQIWVGNDRGVTKNDGIQIGNKQLLLDPHQNGFMLATLTFEPVKPFVAWYSPEIVQRNKELLSGYEAAEQSLPEGEQKESTKKRIAHLKATEQLTQTPGGSLFHSKIIPLDPKTWGTKNFVTEKVEKEKKRVADKAVKKAAN